MNSSIFKKKVKNNYLDQQCFNPTVFLYNDLYYVLLRKETDVINWSKSQQNYIMKIYTDYRLTKCIKKNIITLDNSKVVHRINNDNAIEDLKYFKTEGDSVYFLCNYHYNNNFRVVVAVCKLCMKTMKLHKIKDLSISNQKKFEKNWVIYKNKDKYYILTNLCPRLKIYSVDENYNLNLFKDVDTFGLVKNTHITKRLGYAYKGLYISAIQNFINIGNNKYLFCFKKKDTNSIYEYYYGIFDSNNFKINLYLDEKFAEGNRYYLNNVVLINSRLYKCFGIKDINYEIKIKDIDMNIISKFSNTNDLESIFEYLK